MIVALNHKSNFEKKEYEEYLEKLSTIQTKQNLILCPTFLNIGNKIPERVSLGSQNVSSTENGAYTGEISATQLKSYGVEYTIVGHSERRQYQKESLNDINNKVKLLITNEICPILCVGETLEERKEGKTNEIIRQEITTAIEGLEEKEKQKIIIAYEPIWSIGTGMIPTEEEIKEVLKEIKSTIPGVKCLYGGSANENNVGLLKNIREIDGYLLGGLSLKVENLKIFLKILDDTN